MADKTVGCDYCGTQVAPNAVACPCCGGKDPWLATRADRSALAVIRLIGKAIFWGVIFAAAIKVLNMQVIVLSGEY